MKRLILFLTCVNFIISYPFFPTILTLSLPSNDPKKFRVENTFPRWIQAAGGDLIIIHTWTNKNKLDDLIQNKINGVLFQGNPGDINKESEYYKTVKYIYDKVIEIYGEEENKKIPIMAVGNDMILISQIATNKEVNVTKLELDKPNTIKILKNESLIFSEFQERDIKAIQEKNICPNSLTHAMLYINETINDTFNIIATSKVNETEYISVIEGINYPIFGISFHPEYVSFEQNTKFNIPQNLNSVLAARLIANAFVFYGRNNCNNELSIPEKRNNNGTFEFIDPYVMFPSEYEDRYQFVYSKE